MARTFKIYDNTGQVVAKGHSPLTIPNLTAETTYPEGTFTMTAVEDGEESYWVPVPEFTTLAFTTPAPIDLVATEVRATSTKLSWKKGV